MWTGFHLDSAIFITRLPSRACPASQEELLFPAVLGNARAQAGCEPQLLRSALCRGGCLEKGQGRLKGKKNKLAHLVPPFSPVLPEYRWLGRLHGSWPGSFLPCSSKALAQELQHPIPLLPGMQPLEDFKQGMTSVSTAAYISPTGLNSA